ncbi:MAG: hypothetical protein MI919_00505, partial [Holophagales bacterium]|nr:hypothetical protein [Holophagales bacterium]
MSSDDRSRASWSRRLLRSAYVRDGALMTVSNGLAGGLFLATHMVVGRHLDGVDYALLVALLGLLSVLGVPQATMQIVVARFAAEPEAAWARLLRGSVRQVTRFGLLAFVGWVLCLPWSRHLVPGASAVDLFLIALVAWIGLYTPIFSGALQGRHRFLWLAASGTGGALARLLLATVAALLVGRVDLVLLAWVASYAVSVALAAWPLRAALAVDRGGELGPPTGFGDPRLRRYAAWVLAGQLVFFGLLNADLILAPRLLADDDLAVYGKVAMLCRSVLFLPVPVVLAMFPRAVVSARRRVLLGPLLFASAVAAAAATVVWLRPDLPLELMFGVSGAEYSALARAYVWAAVPLTLDLVIVHYLWARRSHLVALGLAPVVAAYLVLLIFFDGPPTALPGLLGAAAGVALLGLLLAALGSGSRQ